MSDKWAACISDACADLETATLTTVIAEVGFGRKILLEEGFLMGRPNIGDKVIVDLHGDDGSLSRVVVEGPWLSNGGLQGKPTWKIDHGDGFTNWYLEDRITPNLVV